MENASKTPLQTLQILIGLIARGFYSSNHIIVLHALSRKPSGLTDIQLQTFLKINIKQVNGICAKLKQDKLIRVIQIPIQASKYSRMTSRPLFYMDFKQFVDVVKWRMLKIKGMIEQNMENVNISISLNI